jgi:N-acetylneuraminic acid mutarotase
MLLGVLFSCSKASLNYTQNGNWVTRAVFAGIPMGYGASFVVGDNAYVGTGYNPSNPNVKLNTIYQYQPAPIPNTPTGYDSAFGGWTIKAPFPGSGRSNAVGFGIGQYGYLGGGTTDAANTPLSDFYRYDPSSNTWSQIDSIGLPGARAPRFDAVAFGFDTTGFVLTGTDNIYQFGDVWQYSPTGNNWTARLNLPGSPRSKALTWVYNGKGYLVTGYSVGGTWTAGGNACYDFWRFDPSLPDNQAWTRLRDIYNTNSGTYDDGYTNITRWYASGFVIKGTQTGDKGYVTCGQNGSAYAYTWEYDFATDLWTEKTPYEGGARVGAVGFTVQNRGFIATGLSGGAAQQDCREFFPNQIYNQFD